MRYIKHTLHSDCCGQLIFKRSFTILVKIKHSAIG